jgi:putative acetyltransferase
MSKELIKIREEKKEDYDAVQIVNDRAFGTPEEGRIINILREVCQETLSLVAVSDEKIVGHIFFSPVTIDQEDTQVIGMGLAPMAVLPEFQNQGIGSLLAKEGLRRIKETECPFIIVLGHINYYPRFGFERASKYGLKCQWDGVPDEAFMVLVLNKSTIAGISGVAKYRSEFDEAMKMPNNSFNSDVNSASLHPRRLS